MSWSGDVPLRAPNRVEIRPKDDGDWDKIGAESGLNRAKAKSVGMSTAKRDVPYEPGWLQNGSAAKASETATKRAPRDHDHPGIIDLGSRTPQRLASTRAMKRSTIALNSAIV